MEMIQIATTFQEVPPVAALPSRGALSAPGGAFAQLLQGIREDGGDGGGTPLTGARPERGAEAALPGGAAVLAQGEAEAAAEGASAAAKGTIQGESPLASLAEALEQAGSGTATEAGEGRKETVRPAQGRGASVAAEEARVARWLGAATAAPTVVAPNEGEEAAAATAGEEAATATAGEEAAAATAGAEAPPVTVKGKRSEGEAEGKDREREGLAAEAQPIAPVLDPAQLLAGAGVVAANLSTTPGKAGIPQEMAELRSQGEPMPAPVEVGNLAAPTDPRPAGEQSGGAKSTDGTALVVPAANGERPMAAEAERVLLARADQPALASLKTGERGEVASQEKKEGAPAAGGRRAEHEGSAGAPGAKNAARPVGFVATPLAGNPTSPALAKAPGGAKEAAVAAEGGSAAAATPVASEPQTGAHRAEAVQVRPREAHLGQQGNPGGATEGAPKAGAAETAASSLPVAEGEPADTEAELAGTPVAAGDAARRPEARPRGARENHLATPPENGVGEPKGLTQKASNQEASGSKNAATIAAAKSSSLHGGGENGSGDAGKNGESHAGQKAPAGEPDQLQAAGIGAPAAAAEQAAHHEVKGSSQRSALHQSILSQVKDGVVTHDGKGNGEMSIRLNPGELGELKIQVRMEDNRLRVEVQADNRMVKDLLMSNLDSLKEALSGKNFTMEGFEVSAGGGGFNSPLPEERGSSRQQQGFRPGARGYAAPEEARVNYLTADVNNLLDVRF